jgi:hypothetical protein
MIVRWKRRGDGKSEHRDHHNERKKKLENNRQRLQLIQRPDSSHVILVKQKGMTKSFVSFSPESGLRKQIAGAKGENGKEERRDTRVPVPVTGISHHSPLIIIFMSRCFSSLFPLPNK